MKAERAQQQQRERRSLRRRRAAQERSAEEARRQQAAAELRRALRGNSTRHMIAFVMFGVAGVIALAHFFEHFGAFTIVSQGFEDVFLGWPMAALIAFGGAIVYGR